MMEVTNINYSSIGDRYNRTHPTFKFITEHADILNSKVILAGGAIRDLITKKYDVKDYDLYLVNHGSSWYENDVNDIREAELHEVGNDDLRYLINYFKEKGYEVFRTNGITVSMKSTDGTIVQLIYNVPLVSTELTLPLKVDDLLNIFDFTICQFAYYDNTFSFNPLAVVDALNKRLVVHRISYANSSFMRILKYANRGYTICRGMVGNFLQSVIESPEIVNNNIISID